MSNKFLTVYLLIFVNANKNPAVHWLFMLVHGALKGQFTQKIKILSSFADPQVVPNLYKCICFAVHNGRYLGKCL